MSPNTVKRRRITSSSEVAMGKGMSKAGDGDEGCRGGSSSNADVTLVVKGIEFPANRQVLAKGSAFFRLMLMSGQFEESTRERIELKEHVDPKEMELVLRFMYSG